MKSNYYMLFVVCFSLYAQSLSASEASEYCSDLYPADSYESAERSSYIQECLRSYAGHDDGFSDDASTEDDSSDEGRFSGGVNDFMKTIGDNE